MSRLCDSTKTRTSTSMMSCSALLWAWSWKQSFLQRFDFFIDERSTCSLVAGWRRRAPTEKLLFHLYQRKSSSFEFPGQHHKVHRVTGIIMKLWQHLPQSFCLFRSLSKLISACLVLHYITQHIFCTISIQLNKNIHWVDVQATSFILWHQIGPALREPSSALRSGITIAYEV